MKVILFWKTVGIKDILRVARAVLIDVVMIHAVLQEVRVLVRSKSPKGGCDGDALVLLHLHVTLHNILQKH